MNWLIQLALAVNLKKIHCNEIMFTKMSAFSHIVEMYSSDVFEK